MKLKRRTYQIQEDNDNYIPKGNQEDNTIDLTNFSKNITTLLEQCHDSDIKNWDLMTNQCHEMVSPICLSIALTKKALTLSFDTDWQIDEIKQFSHNVFDYLEKHGLLSKTTTKLIIFNLCELLKE